MTGCYFKKKCIEVSSTALLRDNQNAICYLITNWIIFHSPHVGSMLTTLSLPLPFSVCIPYKTIELLSCRKHLQKVFLIIPNSISDSINVKIKIKGSALVQNVYWPPLRYYKADVSSSLWRRANTRKIILQSS